MSNDWLTFGVMLPKAGDNIEVIFPNANPLDMGKVTRIIDVTNANQLSDRAWSLSTDYYHNSVVRDTYPWRLKP